MQKLETSDEKQKEAASRTRAGKKYLTDENYQGDEVQSLQTDSIKKYTVYGESETEPRR